MNKFLNFLCIVLLVGCSANKNIKTELYNDLSQKNKQITLTSIEEVKKLKPQIKLPIKIAISQPRTSYSRAWSLEEIKEIESWLQPLKSSGVASDIVIIPRYFRDGCCDFEDLRTSAAKLQADAVIAIDESVDTDRYLNPLSLLNITIAGMWLAPGHHRDSYAILDAVMIDTNNGYIYGIARGEGEVKSIRPYMFAERDIGQDEARLIALKSLGKDIVEKTKKLSK